MDRKVIHFYTVCREGSFTKAAEKLYISQPALSKSISELESSLRTTLLVRSKSGLELTDTGEVFLESCKEILSIYKNSREEINDLESMSAHSLNIGMIDSLAHRIMGGPYSKFLSDNPDLNIDLSVDNSTRLLQSIYDLELDFAYITKEPEKQSKAISMKIVDERMVLTSMNSVGNEYLKLVGYNRFSNTFRILESQLKSLGFEYDYTAYSSDPYLMRDMVEQGLCEAILPEYLVLDSLKSIEFSDLVFHRPVYLVYLKKSYLSESSKLFISMMNDLLL